MRWGHILQIGASLVLGFVAGTISSTFTLEFLDSSAKAALLTHELRRLRNGDIDEYISTMEVDLDGAIYNHVRYKNGIYPFLAWPASIQYDHDKYMRTVLNYRNEFPLAKLSDGHSVTNEERGFWESHEKQLELDMKTIRGWYGE